MKVLVDTNVMLDVLLDRSPHALAAAQVFSLVDGGRIEGGICATTVTTVHYLAAKAGGRDQAGRLLANLLDIFAVAPVDQEVLSAATALRFDDFEDAVIHEAARAWGATGVVTRDRRGFARATLPVFGPEELLSALIAGGD